MIGAVLFDFKRPDLTVGHFPSRPAFRSSESWASRELKGRECNDLMGS